MSKELWLANAVKRDNWGTATEVELLDGPHSTPADVAKAFKLIKGIGLDKGMSRDYVMVTVEPVSTEEVEVNEKAMAVCKKVVDGSQE